VCELRGLVVVPRRAETSASRRMRPLPTSRMRSRRGTCLLEVGLPSVASSSTSNDSPSAEKAIPRASGAGEPGHASARFDVKHLRPSPGGDGQETTVRREIDGCRETGVAQPPFQRPRRATAPKGSGSSAARTDDPHSDSSDTSTHARHERVTMVPPSHGCGGSCRIGSDVVGLLKPPLQGHCTRSAQRFLPGSGTHGNGFLIFEEFEFDRIDQRQPTCLHDVLADPNRAQTSEPSRHSMTTRTRAAVSARR